MASNLTERVTAADVIEFIHAYCFIPEGPYVGQPLRLLPWQQDWIRLVYDNPHGTRRAILEHVAEERQNGSDRLLSLSRTSAARRRTIAPTARSIPPPSPAIRPRSSSTAPPRWCG